LDNVEEPRQNAVHGESSQGHFKFHTPEWAPPALKGRVSNKQHAGKPTQTSVLEKRTIHICFLIANNTNDIVSIDLEDERRA
jgi:hypothetical protein